MSNRNPTPSRRWTRAFAASLATIVLVLAHMTFAGSAVSAASGSVYDGKSPYYNDCVSGAYVIHAKDLYKDGYKGTMQVMYSPRCGTNWVRSYLPFTGSDGGNCVASYKRIERPAQGSLTKYVEVENDLDCRGGPVLGWTYSMMVYAPGSTSVKASVTHDYSISSVSHSVTLS